MAPAPFAQTEDIYVTGSVCGTGSSNMITVVQSHQWIHSLDPLKQAKAELRSLQVADLKKHLAGRTEKMKNFPMTGAVR